MPTANETIRDGLIAHQVDLLRFGRGMALRLIKLLNRSEPELREVIKARLAKIEHFGGDIGPTVTKRLLKIEQTYREVMRPAWQEIGNATREELRTLAKLETASVVGIVSGALPVIIDLEIPDSATLRAIVTNSPIDGAPLERWLSKWEENDRGRVMNEIRTGLLFSETPTQISRRIFGSRDLQGANGARNITRRGAQALASTAVSAITNQVKRQIYQANADVIKQELYVATLDSRTTPICRSLDGERYPVGEGPLPPLHIRCRSLRVPAFDGEQLGDRPSNTVTDDELAGLKGAERRARVKELVGRVPAKTTYQQWLEGQSASFQDEVLGRTRGRLFRRGEITLDKFVDNHGRQYTIAELRDRLPASALEAAGV